MMPLLHIVSTIQQTINPIPFGIVGPEVAAIVTVIHTLQLHAPAHGNVECVLLHSLWCFISSINEEVVQFAKSQD